jgi:hypothetical protein
LFFSGAHFKRTQYCIIREKNYTHWVLLFYLSVVKLKII